MVEPEVPECASNWPLLAEKAIIAGPIHKGKSAAYVALLLESVDSDESESAAGGE